jgi:hypothetical protein
MNTDDRWAITETLARTGHVGDSGDIDRRKAVFTSDVVYDMSAIGAGMPVISGTEAVRERALRMGANGPVAHHVTNVVIVGEDEVQVEVDSRACCSCPMSSTGFDGGSDYTVISSGAVILA